MANVRSTGRAVFLVLRSLDDAAETVQACYFKDKADPRSNEALKFLEKGACNLLEEFCVKDPDFVTMFRLMSSLKPLGFRKANVKFDIQFPTRSQLKSLVARLIRTRREQLAMGFTDIEAQNTIAILSSTDTC